MLLAHSPPSAAPRRESAQSAQVREATAYLLVFEPFGFRPVALPPARLAQLLALWRVLLVPLAPWELELCLRLPWLYSNAPQGLSGAKPNGSYSWRANACFFGWKLYNFTNKFSCASSSRFKFNRIAAAVGI